MPDLRRCAPGWRPWRALPGARRRHSSRSRSCSSMSSARPRSSQHLDPEEIHAVMDGALTRCTAIVEAISGKVLQYAGDNLLAVFGADEGREDDAERAVRCGLALLAEGRALGERSEAPARPRGLRRARRRAHRRRAAGRRGRCRRQHPRHRRQHRRSHGADRAAPARCASATTPTATCAACSRSRRRHRIAVKGVDEPVATYLVQRAKPRAFRVASRGIEGVETRMIGRDAELAALQRAFKRLFVERRPALVTVVGEAGLGKSRLLYEFEAWSEARPEAFYVFQGRANPLTAEPALRPAARHPRLAAADRRRRQRRRRQAEDSRPASCRCSGPTRAPDMAEAHAHLLGHLIGLDFSDSRHIARHPGRRPADPQPRLPRRGADVPPLCGRRRANGGRRSCCSSKTCTGPTTARSTS